MNDLQVFENPAFGRVRAMELNGEPWFVGKDVAQVLGYADTNQAIRMHVDDEDKLTRQFNGSGQKRDMVIINESGLYSLILSSKQPKAKKFKRWVTKEVLPSIRKTGQYATQQCNKAFAETQRQILERLERLERTRPAFGERQPGLYIPDEKEYENLERLNSALDELVELVAIPRNMVLHQLYVALESLMDISVNAYTSVYRSETANRYASPLHMIAANEEVFREAMDLLTSTIERKRIFE